jgi:hypothetical protein
VWASVGHLALTYRNYNALAPLKGVSLFKARYHPLQEVKAD